MVRKLDYNEHVLTIFKRLARLPVVLPQVAWRLVARCCSTAAGRRTKDGVRQSRVRRALRGLPSDHDQKEFLAREHAAREA